MQWQTKATVFNLLSALPFAQQFLYLTQRYVTRQWPRPVHALDLHLRAARRILDNAPHRQARFLEIGAGGDLATAIGLRLMGVEHVTCVDVTRLARLPLVRHAIAHLGRRLGVSTPVVQSWRDLASFGIEYGAPQSLEGAAIERGSIDCFYSVDTLEHIPPSDLQQVLRHARGLMTTDGVGVHMVDYSDHYARADGHLSRFNFLTFDEPDWKRFNGPLHYVNRLRHSQYLDLLASAGWTPTHIEADTSPVEETILDGLAQQFRGFDAEDLFTLRALIVVKPNP